MEKIEEELSLTDFLESFREEFMKYAHHIVASWFLRSTKLELFRPSKDRQSILTIISDFGEAFLVVGKHETADQFSRGRKLISMVQSAPSCHLYWGQLAMLH